MTEDKLKEARGLVEDMEKPHIQRYRHTSWYQCSLSVRGRRSGLRFTLVQAGPTPLEAYNALARWQGLPPAESPVTPTK